MKYVFANKYSRISEYFFIILSNFTVFLSFAFYRIAEYQIIAILGYLVGILLSLKFLPQSSRVVKLEFIYSITTIYFLFQIQNIDLVSLFVFMMFTGFSFLFAVPWRTSVFNIIVYRDPGSMELVVENHKILYKEIHHITLTSGSNIEFIPYGGNTKVLPMGLCHYLTIDGNKIKISPYNLGLFDLVLSLKQLFADFRIIFRGLPHKIPRLVFMEKPDKFYTLYVDQPNDFTFPDFQFTRGLNPRWWRSIPFLIFYLFNLLIGIVFVILIYREIFYWKNLFSPVATITYYIFLLIFSLFAISFLYIGLNFSGKTLAYDIGTTIISQINNYIIIEKKWLSFNIKYQIPTMLNPHFIVENGNYYLKLSSESSDYFSYYLGKTEQVGQN